MRTHCLLLTVLALTTTARGAERSFNWGPELVGALPPGFRQAASGATNAPDWKIVLDEVPSAIPSVTPGVSSTSKRPVLAQTAAHAVDDYFPLLIGDEVYSDFKFTTRFKIVTGKVDRMAGVAFRIQDENNYYVVRASSSGRSFRFYKFVQGTRSSPIGPEIDIPAGEWHEITVDCAATRIRCLLDGKEVIPPLEDTSFTAGRIGFWTKADSVSYFADARITYTPREPVAQALIRDFAQYYNRLRELTLYTRKPGETNLVVLASNKAEKAGQPGSRVEQDVIDRDVPYHGKAHGDVTVTLPFHDQNGEPMAAVRITMESFPGQTAENAVARAAPIVRKMESRVRTKKELLE